MRDKLILPALNSDRIYIVDTGKNPRAPTMHKVTEMYNTARKKLCNVYLILRIQKHVHIINNR